MSPRLNTSYLYPSGLIASGDSLCPGDLVQLFPWRSLPPGNLPYLTRRCMALCAPAIYCPVPNPYSPGSCPAQRHMARLEAKLSPTGNLPTPASFICGIDNRIYLGNYFFGICRGLLAVFLIFPNFFPKYVLYELILGNEAGRVWLR